MARKARKRTASGGEPGAKERQGTRGRFVLSSAIPVSSSSSLSLLPQPEGGERQSRGG